MSVVVSRCKSIFYSDFGILSRAWQLVVCDNIFLALFQEALAAVHVIQEPSRKNRRKNI